MNFSPPCSTSSVWKRDALFLQVLETIRTLTFEWLIQEFRSQSSEDLSEAHLEIVAVI